MSEKTDPKKDDLEVNEKDAAAIKGGRHLERHTGPPVPTKAPGVAKS